MKNKKKQPEIGKIYRHNCWQDGVLLVQVLDYPLLPEEHPYDKDETVLRIVCLDGSGDMCLEKLEDFWEYFDEATATEIALYAVYMQ